MAYFESGPSKKMRTGVNGSYNTKSSGSHDFYHKPPSPSSVLQITGLPDTVIEADLYDALQHYGQISRISFGPNKTIAFVEFMSMNEAIQCVKAGQESGIFVAGRSVGVRYATSDKMSSGGDSYGGPNNVLLMTIVNPAFQISTDVLFTICNPHGPVQRIVIFKKNGVQAMVEFDSVDSAARAKDQLNGADIYAGCCTLKIEYAKPKRLNVFKNDSETYDYTNPNPGQGPAAPKKPGSGLLAHPPNQPTPPASAGNHDRYSPSLPPQGYGGPPARSGGPPSHRHSSSRPPPRGADNYDSGYTGSGGSGYDGGYSRERGGGFSSGGPPNDSFSGGDQGYGYEQGGFGFDNPSYNQGAVLMMYNMEPEKINCDKLFNLLCLYGNVGRMKFMKSKPGSAMIQMGSRDAVDQGINNLKGLEIFGKPLEMGYSRQDCVAEQSPRYVSKLTDNTPTYKDFSNDRNNRYLTPQAASKNRTQTPIRWVHFYNAPPDASKEKFDELGDKTGAPPIKECEVFDTKSERSSSGLLEFETISEATEFLLCVNHQLMDHPQGKFPYTLKLCFAMGRDLK